MNLKKHWLSILIKINKHMFCDTVDKIMIQLWKNNKSIKIKITAAKFIENQNMFHIQKIKTFKISIVFVKCITDILVMGLHTLILLLLTAAIGWAQTCYRPGGSAADYRYVPCNAGKQSMCCRTNDDNIPDICRPDRLCQATYQYDIIWRESCTDQSWQSPGCLKLCPGESS